MIKSMTGFGIAEAQNDNITVDGRNQNPQFKVFKTYP